MKKNIWIKYRIYKMKLRIDRPDYYNHNNNYLIKDQFKIINFNKIVRKVLKKKITN